MNYRMIGYLLGVILAIEAALLLFPLLVALIYGESMAPYLLTILILAVASVLLMLLKPKNTRIYAKEGFVCVAAAWILLSAFGALPFVFDGAITNYVDAFFETASGFTTTGATVLSAVEHLHKGILFWRSFTHWVGGMGVLVFMLAIVPADGRAIHLMRAEVPGPTKGKLVPRMRQTALILYGIYVLLTVAETVALCIAGMPFYDALVNSFATAGTGGFALKNTSIAAYANPAAEWIIAIFMFLCGVNFNLYFFLLIRRFRDVWRSEELRAYILLCGTSTLLIAANVFHVYKNVGDTLRIAFFQVTSIMSTTGFSTVDFNLWPEFSKTILVILIMLGACAGSTAGGLKISRALLLCKNVWRELKHILHPRSVMVTRLDGEPISDETCRTAANYFSLYLGLIAICTLILSLDGYDLTTNLTATLTCINNVGPGLGLVGPLGNFGIYSDLSTLMLSFLMLLGRLEIIPLFILFSPSTWKKRG
ncbi:MAG: TrkH family potassium uptake protein [Clostridia bacterium]|nr:TrkH family potassium uptake protein [Clostridia bacterium]